MFLQVYFKVLFREILSELVFVVVFCENFECSFTNSSNDYLYTYM